MSRPTKILVTGGTGKTGRAVVDGLRRRGVPHRIAARTPAAGTVRFDWMDETTHDAALAGVDGVYLVAPVGVLDPVPAMSSFVERALEAGVRRFVLLGSSAVPIDGPAMGRVHRVLADRAPEWTVLRPSWFMQNFTEGHHGDTIRREDAICSATGDAAVAFIDADDIGEVGAVCLCADRPIDGEVILTGPTAHGYDDIAEIVSSRAGRRIAHVRLDPSALARRFGALGLDADYAEFLAGLDAFLAGGSEARTTTAVHDLTGRPARSFADFARANEARWARDPAWPPAPAEGGPVRPRQRRDRGGRINPAESR